MFYVYVHKRLDTGAIFYVGKGTGRRAWDKCSRNKHWRAVAGKTSWTHEIVLETQDEKEALAKECELIASLILDGVKLCNKTSGGEGVSGMISPKRIPVHCSNGMRFDYVDDAAKFFGISPSTINDACKGKLKSAAGHAWWREGFEPKVYVNPSITISRAVSKPVRNDRGETFPSAKAASDHYGISRTSITLAVNGQTKKCHGMRWWFVKGDLPDMV